MKEKPRNAALMASPSPSPSPLFFPGHLLPPSPILSSNIPCSAGAEEDMWKMKEDAAGKGGGWGKKTGFAKICGDFFFIT